MKDKYNKKAVVPPKAKGNRDVINKLVQGEPAGAVPQVNVNTEIQVPVKEERKIKKATFELDAVLHKRLRTFAVLNDTTMLDVVEKAINEYLDRIEK